MSNVAAVEAARPAKKREWGVVALPILVVLVAAFGVLMVYSASYYAAEKQFDDAFYFMKKQFVGFILGIVAMLTVGFFPYRSLKKLKWPALIVSLALLAAVFIPGLGVENYGATRWIGLGSITIQPSEIAKFGFIIFAAAYASENPERMKKFTGMLPVLAAGGGICLLIIAEPNMSVTMVVGILMVAMLFLSGVKIRHFLIILLPIALAVPVLIVMEPYRLQRLYAFLDPWSSPQVIGEEFGYVGIILLFLVFGAIVFCGIRTAARCKDMFGFLTASGITAVYAIQVVINALVVSGSIPPTGLPLPLVSSGNTSLIITMAAMGVLYNISRGGKGWREKKKE